MMSVVQWFNQCDESAMSSMADSTCPQKKWGRTKNNAMSKCERMVTKIGRNNELFVWMGIVSFKSMLMKWTIFVAWKITK
jgi:hypothetical protein